MRVAVIGVDGADWKIIGPLIEKGYLPNLANMAENGVVGNLETVIPPVTFPSWKCYSTGKLPQKLGVFGFRYFDSRSKKIGFNNSRSFRDKEIWDVLTDNGLKSIVINMPSTYPVKKIKGIMISGPFDSVRLEKSVHPPTLLPLLRELKYKICVDSLHEEKGGKNRIKEIYEITRKKVKLLKKLLKTEDFDFLHFTIFYLSDDLQHHYWDHTLPIEKNEIIFNAWKEIDKIIGEINNVLPEEDLVKFVISDHGFRPLKYEFFINSFFKEIGLLSLKKQENSTLREVTKITVDILRKSKLLALFNKILPIQYRKKISRMMYDIDLSMVNWEESTAFGLEQGQIYIINKEKLSDEEYQNMKMKIARELDKLKLKGIKVVDRTILLENKNSQKKCDIVVLPSNGFEIKSGLRKSIFYPSLEWKATHDLYGIFIAQGPTIRKNFRIHNVRIVDLAPTIYKIFNIEPPKDLDGRILEEIFEK